MLMTTQSLSGPGDLYQPHRQRGQRKMAEALASQWVKVEFYGLVPAGQVVTDVDPLEVGANLIRAFGFTHIDGLTISAASLPVVKP